MLWQTSVKSAPQNHALIWSSVRLKCKSASTHIHAMWNLTGSVQTINPSSQEVTFQRFVSVDLVEYCRQTEGTESELEHAYSKLCGLWSVCVCM